MDEVARILEVGLQTGQNVVLHGPGGHGKSEFVSAWMAEAGFKPFVQFCGEGLDEARLFGGLDFAKLNAGKNSVVEYCVQRSFLPHEVAVFEELFDAPPNVLLCLKDVLTSRELRNGAQRAPMDTKFIVACTNRDPAELAELGPAVAALVERFPLQMRVAWDSYKAEDYSAMFRCVLGEDFPQLSELLEEAADGGNIVSPRSAIHAAKVLKNGSYNDLQFIPSLSHFASEMASRLRRIEQRQNAERMLDQHREKVAELRKADQSTPLAALKAAKQLMALATVIEGLTVPDAMVKSRNDLACIAMEHKSTLIERALDLTRV